MDFIMLKVYKKKCGNTEDEYREDVLYTFLRTLISHSIFAVVVVVVAVAFHFFALFLILFFHS